MRFDDKKTPNTNGKGVSLRRAVGVPSHCAIFPARLSGSLIYIHAFLNITPTCNYIAWISRPFIFFSGVRTKDSEKLSGNNCRPVLNCGQVVARRWAGVLLLWKQGWFLTHALRENNKSLKSTNSQRLLSVLLIFSTNVRINLL